MKRTDGCEGSDVDFVHGDDPADRVRIEELAVRWGRSGGVVQAFVEPSRLPVGGSTSWCWFRVELRPITYVIDAGCALVGEVPVGRAALNLGDRRETSCAALTCWRCSGSHPSAPGRAGSRGMNPPPERPAVTDHDIRFGHVELCLAEPDRGRALLTGGYGFVDASSDRFAGGWLRRGAVDVLVRGIDDPAARDHVAAHGDMVSDLALVCHDPGATIRRGREADLDVYERDGAVRVDMTGDRTLCHAIRRVARTSARPRAHTHIDHVAFCLPHGAGDRLAATYEHVFGFERLDVTECAEVGNDVAGMRSIVVRCGASATIVLTEPSTADGGGQTKRFVDRHHAPGVQHLALGVTDICAAVATSRDRGVRFLETPPGYYADARRRLNGAGLPWGQLEELRILADADERGLLLQVFARPLTEDGGFFFEFIQRAAPSGSARTTCVRCSTSWSTPRRTRSRSPDDRDHRHRSTAGHRLAARRRRRRRRRDPVLP